MLQSFDGMELLEAGMSWAGGDCLLDPWLHDDPFADYGDVGRVSSAIAETLEAEQTFSALRSKLIDHYDYKKRNGELM